ncbi:MAG: FAD-dependent oxidoreductase [Gemmatimonadota bacterium]|nr:FAD-dependent oxidoreductase [Gemmatimonadota bacterium]
MSAPSTTPASDVIVVGGGIIGLACAAAIADRGIAVTLVGESLAGEASPASAGLLAPSIATGSDGARAFAIAARDRFPSFVDLLARETGITIPLWRDGILELAMDGRAASRMEENGGGTWLARAQLLAEEPAITEAAGAMLYERDGAADSVALVGALRVHLTRFPRVRQIAGLVTRISVGSGATEVETSTGERLRADRIVLAAGAWVVGIAGIPRPLPVEPVRGQMLALGSTPVRHPTFGPSGYIVPRAGVATLVGATSERVGFDARTTADGLDHLMRAARMISPVFGRVAVLRSWAGLRPMTPDLLPIIGADPDVPELIYACGHSRNGVLLSAITGDVVADIVTGGRVAHDLAPFAVSRFADS